MATSFELLETGTRGHLEMVRLVNSGNVPSITIPVNIPPVLTSLRDQIQRYTDDPSPLPVHDDSSGFKHVPRVLKYDRLVHSETSPLKSIITGRRDGATGQILELVEEQLPVTSKVSSHTGNVQAPDRAYLSTPPGFKNGLTFDNDGADIEGNVMIGISDLSILSGDLSHFVTQQTSYPHCHPKAQDKGAKRTLSGILLSLEEQDLDLLLWDDSQCEHGTKVIEPEHSINNQSINKHLTSKQVTNEHLTSKHSINEKLTSNQGTNEHLTSKQVTNEHLTSKQVTNEHLTSQQVTNEHLTIKHSTNEHWTRKQGINKNLTSTNVSSENLSSKQVTNEHLSSNQVTTEHLFNEKLISEKLNNELPTQKRAPPQTQRQPPRPDQWAVLVDINESVQDFHERIPQMAFQWHFELDTFQKQAIIRLENNESVFVAAHTSAGKTVVAEYAIALSIRHMTRTIYTSPVKALSNQKYRDLKMTFSDVGLMTGDIQIDDTASCIVMTTEILRTMLYEGSDIFQELEWVIIDEVHYINDADRGVVWEEVLIMLPDYVKIVMLSATVPNTMELAEWVGRIKRKQVHVITTKIRPVPLQHFLYTGAITPCAPNGLFMFIDEQGRFVEHGYYMAMSSIQRKNIVNPVEQEKQFWKSVINMIRKNKTLPAVIFYFSKKKINDITSYTTQFSLTSQSEREEISSFVDKCLTKLEPRDHKLPQVKMLTDLLQRGFGVHHSGILTMFREMIEILFQKGLVKVLLATETFAMGVNMPARTVLFESVMKFDGKALRPVLSSEYTQMSGRAGRRGHDTTGTVIVLCNGEVPNLENLQKIALGIPPPLESKFRLTYSMILHLMRVEMVKVHDMMKRSFSEFHTKRESFRELQHVKTQVGDLKEIRCYPCSKDLSQYHAECVEFYRLHEQLQAQFVNLPRVAKAMTPRRVLMVRKPTNKIVFGVLLATYVTEKYETKFKTFILRDYFIQQSHNDVGVHPVEMCTMYIAQSPWYEVVELSTKDIFGVTGLVMDSLKTNSVLRCLEQIQITTNQRYLPDIIHNLILTLHQLSCHFCYGLSSHLTFSDLEKQGIELASQWGAICSLWRKLLTHNYNCRRCPQFREHFYVHDRNTSLREKHTDFQKRASEEYLSLLPEYHQRVQVLRKLQYISERDVTLIKARVACCFIKHEVVITEVIMENVLTDLEPTEIAALLSCFVLQRDTNRQPSLRGALEKGQQRILQLVEQVGMLQVETGMKIPVEFLKNELHFGLTQVVHDWANGKAFSDLMTQTDADEGVITSCIQSLHDLLARVKAAGELIGNQTLSEKCQAAMTAIRRDIVFAASLYLQGPCV